MHLVRYYRSIHSILLKTDKKVFCDLYVGQRMRKLQSGEESSQGVSEIILSVINTLHELVSIFCISFTTESDQPVNLI